MPDYLRLIDRDTTGDRCDVTPLLADHAAFSRLLDDLLGLVGDTPFEAVAAVDALGFVLGTALALRAGRRLVLVRKGGKLPVRADVAEFVDYTGQSKSLELRPDAVTRGRGCWWWTSGWKPGRRSGPRFRWSRRGAPSWSGSPPSTSTPTPPPICGGAATRALLYPTPEFAPQRRAR